MLVLFFLFISFFSQRVGHLRPRYSHTLFLKLSIDHNVAVNTNTLDSSQGFFLLGSRSEWGDRGGEDQSCCEILHHQTWRADIRMDDFVRTEILGCMDNQIVLPTALRCALRSPQRRELRLKISKLCVLSANLCALKRMVDRIKRFQCWKKKKVEK